jgi:hypothetical protein
MAEQKEVAADQPDAQQKRRVAALLFLLLMVSFIHNITIAKVNVKMIKDG